MAKKISANVTLGPERPLRVLTLNLFGFTEPYEERQRLLRSNIKQLDPDLMCFQEAGYDGDRHQVNELLGDLGYHIMHHFEHLSTLPRKDGNCIASRWKMELVELLPFAVSPRSQNPGFVAMAVRVYVPEPFGPLLLVNPVTSWQQDHEYEREQQVLAMARMIKGHADPNGFPSIIAGDFTAAPDTASIRFLSGKQSLDGMSVHYLDAWIEGGDGTCGHTWTHENLLARQVHERIIRQRNHARRIDYIFIGSPHDYARFAMVRNCRVVLNRPENGLWPSDHYAVYAEIDTKAGT